VAEHDALVHDSGITGEEYVRHSQYTIPWTQAEVQGVVSRKMVDGMQAAPDETDIRLGFTDEIRE
jgi:hypothetical protein